MSKTRTTPTAARDDAAIAEILSRDLPSGPDLLGDILDALQGVECDLALQRTFVSEAAVEGVSTVSQDAYAGLLRAQDRLIADVIALRQRIEAEGGRQ